MKLEELVNELELPLEERDRLALVTDDHEVVFIVLGEHEEGVVVAPHRRESLVEVFLYGGIHLSEREQRERERERPRWKWRCGFTYEHDVLGGAKGEAEHV